MPKVIKKRLAGKSQNEETLSETVVDLRERLKERQKTLVYGLIAFGAVVLLVVAVMVYTRVTTSKAAALQTEGYRIFFGETTIQYTSPADRYKSALEKFQKAYDTKKSPVTLLYIANSYYELGNYDEAIKTLKDLTSRYSDLRIVSLAHYKLSSAYLKKGDANSALTTLTNLAGIKDSPLQDLALLESGKVLETMGKKEEAKAKYKELIDKFPKSSLVPEARARLGS
ncbi:MAG: tetratricopeptide repeat protein [Alphaproteobacteria bacterium]|uniref:Tetratricopeptide repeat protein n=1 Tax=Candidatus Nitrobium versatile TaxID=2884831 RepID=A0A953J7K1_9BACT|nr:tetratricopeptide repeat protein [Candidatus Nitrobium versatile]